MNLTQALAWNVGTLPVMLRENPISGDPTKGESINAHEGDGSSSSSVEGPVMGLERRG